MILPLVDDVDAGLGSKVHLQDLRSSHQRVTNHENDIANVTKAVRELSLFPDSNSRSRLHESSSERTELRGQDDNIGFKDSSDDEVQNHLIGPW